VRLAAEETVEWVKGIVPLLTFMLGLGAGVWQSRRERKRRLRNVRTILRLELVDNLRLLVRVLPREAHPDEAHEHALLVMRNVESLSWAVYGEYLGRLDELTKDQLAAVYEAYDRVELLGGAARAVLIDSASDDPAVRKQAHWLSKTRIALVDHARLGVETALKALGASPHEISEVEAEWGSVFTKLDEAQETARRSD
jgi:hypothetical protein